MTLFAPFSQAVLDVILGMLLPLLLPHCASEDAARAAALELLATHDPRTAKELCLAAETVATNLRGLTLLAQSNGSDMSAEQRLAAVACACRLDHAGARAQRRLDEAQRARQRQYSAAPCTEPAVSSEPQTEAGASEPDASPADDFVSAAPVAAADPAQPAKPAAPMNVTEAEQAFKAAETLLKLMKARWKGAPPPHSQAAQQIKAQERAVNGARMALAQIRARMAAAGGAAGAAAAASAA